MSFISTLGLITILLVIITGDKIVEFCTQSFNITCEASDEVVIIKNAAFGIMGLGRCFNTTHGVECVADVTDRLNKHCLGKRSCHMKYYLNELKVFSQCSKLYTDILKVSYKCQKVERAACVSCSQIQKALVSASEGYLASNVSPDGSRPCGTQYCPWLIQGQAGQKINITLFDYSGFKNPGDNQAQSSDKHTKLFSIKDKTHVKDRVVFQSSKGLFVRHVYTSLHSEVEVHVHATYPFLIHYQVLGCTDLKVSEGSWAQRTGDQLKVGCTHSEEALWSLVCMHNEWKGRLGSCVEGVLAGMPGISQHFSLFFSSLPFSIVIAGVVAMAIILSVCILTIGFVCYRRSNLILNFKASRGSSSDQYVDITDPNSSLVQKMMATQKKKYATAQRENKYAMNNRAGTRPLPSIPPAGLNSAAPPRMMIRSYGDGMKRQSGGNKYYCIDHTLGHPDLTRKDLDMFPPPPDQLLQSSETGSAGRQQADKLFIKNNTYENQQAILGTMATAGITAAAAASSELLNKSVSSNERGVCISAPLNI